MGYADELFRGKDAVREEAERFIAELERMFREFWWWRYPRP